jgi:hypothetical protein
MTVSPQPDPDDDADRSSLPTPPAGAAESGGGRRVCSVCGEQRKPGQFRDAKVPDVCMFCNRVKPADIPEPAAPELVFEIQPFVGAQPLAFGMTADQVQAAFAASPMPGENEREQLYTVAGAPLAVRFDAGVLVEIAFEPQHTVTFKDKRLFGLRSVSDPISFLRHYGGKPVEYLGFVIFPSLAVALTGFHSGASGLPTITIFREGQWDGHVERAEPYLRQ